MEIFKPGWNFNSLNRVEISSWLNSKLFFKMTLQLHEKISTRSTELKFQLYLAKPRWNFNPGWKFQIFHIIDIFSNPGWKFDTTHAWTPCLFFLKKFSIYMRLLYLNQGWNFSCNCNFFQLGVLNWHPYNQPLSPYNLF